MLPPGSVSLVSDYYFTAPRYRAELKRALGEFLDGGRMSQYGGALFNEWFLFDFVLSDGYTPLEEFVAKNPLSLPDAALNVYRNLHENTYGLFEVVAVERKKGVTLKDVRTGVRWQVQEDRATGYLRKGDLLFERIGKADGHYELVGADSPILRGADAAAAGESFRSRTKRVTPKEAHGWMRERFDGR